MKKLLVPLVLLPALAAAATVVNSFDAPDTGISSLAWDGVTLWALDGTTQYVYRLDPTDGALLGSFYVEDQSADLAAGGMTYVGGSLYISMYQAGTMGEVYKYDTSGTLLSQFNCYC